MGTTYSVQVVTGPGGLQGSDDLDRAIRADLDRINALMSTWDPNSELSRFNRSTSAEPFPLSRETFEVFQWARQIGALTGGALDVTVAPLLEAWGFGPGGPRDHAPRDDEIARMRQAVGLDLLELDEQRLTVRKKRPDVRCELAAVASGYAADRLATRLADRGLKDFLVDVGGEMRAQGRNDVGAPWQVAIERPDAPTPTRWETRVGDPVEGVAVHRVVALSDLAITTSGDYRNVRDVDALRVSHILDPRTGRPIAHRLASVTVIDALAVRADAFATALMVLGLDDGMKLAERLDLAALFLQRGEGGALIERTTSRFDALTRAR
jgi:thiamine biosynthesis lipoprotein